MANAIKVLLDGHNSVRIMCIQLPAILPGDHDEEEAAATRLVALLRNHSTLEEEMVYPLLADRYPDLIEQSEAEHEAADRILAEIEERPAGPELRRNVADLWALVQQHVAKEEREVFPLLEQMFDLGGLEALGRRMIGRQQELIQESVETVGSAAAGRPKNIYPKL
jgi:hemerythrin-like domain-containing protein